MLSIGSNLRRLFFAVAFGMIALSPLHAVVDVTTVGAIPNDGLNDSPAIQAAINSYAAVYIPPGVYTLNSTIFLSSDRSVDGAGMEQTQFVLGNDTVAFRINGKTNVCMANFSIDRPFDNSREEMIFAYNGCQNLRLSRIKTTNQRSRAPSLSIYNSTNVTVQGCVTVDNMRDIFEDGQDQVYGSGITFHTCVDVHCEYNEVYETRNLANPQNPYFNYFQAGSIQASNCTNINIRYNKVDIAGQAIDTSGSQGGVIEGNVINNCHSVGIKLVNGSSNLQVINNYIGLAGLVAIWISPGSTDLSCHDNLIDNNIIHKVGEGIGEGWWDNTFSGTMPSAIHLDNANSQAGRLRDNTVSNNRMYDSPQANEFVIVRPSDLSAINTTLTNNTEPGGATPPAPTIVKPYMASCGLKQRVNRWMNYN